VPFLIRGHTGTADGAVWARISGKLAVGGIALCASRRERQTALTVRLEDEPDRPFTGQDEPGEYLPVKHVRLPTNVTRQLTPCMMCVPSASMPKVSGGNGSSFFDTFH